MAVLGLALAGKVSAQTNVTQFAQIIWDDTVASSNTVYSPFFGRKLTGDADEAGVAGLFNFNGVVAAGLGIVHQWQPNGHNAASTYNFSATLQIKETVRPLETFGETNFAFTVWGSTAIGTPFSGDNDGNLMNANCVGLVVQIWSWNIGSGANEKQITLDVDGFYQNQTGTGYYNGNWIAAGPAGGIEDDSEPGTPVAIKVGIKF